MVPLLFAVLTTNDVLYSCQMYQKKPHAGYFTPHYIDDSKTLSAFWGLFTQKYPSMGCKIITHTLCAKSKHDIVIRILQLEMNYFGTQLTILNLRTQEAQQSPNLIFLKFSYSYILGKLIVLLANNLSQNQKA